MLKAIAFKTSLLTGLIILFAGALVVPSADSTDLNQGLVGYWKFDEDSGTVLHDYSGNGNNGTIYGGPTWVAGISGYALYFDGSNDYVDIGNPASLNPENAITLTAWYVPVSFYGSGNDPIIDKGYISHNDPFYQYHLGVSGDLYSPETAGFESDIAADGVWYPVTTWVGFWTVGNWYFIVGTYDGSMVRIYVNGDSINSAPASGTMQDYGKNVFFAKFCNLDYYLPGTIDEVRIYNRALNYEEIAELYCEVFRGDADGDGTINPADVAYLINYLFIGGPAPDPLCLGDCNCDGKINGADVAYLINYLFVSGPPPGC